MTTLTTTAPATTAGSITLELHHCNNRATYLVTWEGPDAEARAIAYVAARGATHAFAEVDDSPLPDTCTTLLDALYPTCEHGMSDANCSGPNHFAEPGDPGWD
jgi:hypothetical protein